MFRSIHKPLLTLVLSITVAASALASGINGINPNGMPNRISMNVTVPKQTQGSSFGEKVNAGLQAAGSVVANGASLMIECGAAACAVALPDGTGLKDTLKTQVRMAAPQRVRMRFTFTVADGTLRARPDSAANSIVSAGG